MCVWSTMRPHHSFSEQSIKIHLAKSSKSINFIAHTRSVKTTNLWVAFENLPTLRNAWSSSKPKQPSFSLSLATHPLISSVKLAVQFSLSSSVPVQSVEKSVFPGRRSSKMIASVWKVNPSFGTVERKWPRRWRWPQSGEKVKNQFWPANLAVKIENDGPVPSVASCGGFRACNRDSVKPAASAGVSGGLDLRRESKIGWPLARQATRARAAGPIVGSITGNEILPQDDETNLRRICSHR